MVITQCQCEKPVIRCGSDGCRCVVCGNPERWEISDETRRAAKEIDDNIALAAIRARDIIVD